MSRLVYTQSPDDSAALMIRESGDPEEARPIRAGGGDAGWTSLVDELVRIRTKHPEEAIRFRDGYLEFHVCSESVDFLRSLQQRHGAHLLLSLSDYSFGLAADEAVRFQIDCLVWCLAHLGRESAEETGGSAWFVDFGEALWEVSLPFRDIPVIEWFRADLRERLQDVGEGRSGWPQSVVGVE